MEDIVQMLQYGGGLYCTIKCPANEGMMGGKL